MDFGPLGREVFQRTYSRTKADGSKETWEEVVDRVVAGNAALAGLLGVPERDELVARIKDFRIIPAGRHLWASGTDSGLGLFNCHRAGWGPGLADHFCFTFDQLMLGGGVGANYSSEYLEELDTPQSTVKVEWSVEPMVPAPNVYVVPDTREGWVDALRHLIEQACQFHGQPVSVVPVKFDLSQVRPAGAPIRGFGGTASGPEPLGRMLEDVGNILNASLGFVSPLAAMEIDHAIASCVVAGNVRRSARMSILHWRDEFIMDFLSCKEDPSLHWSTNISVEVDEDFWAAYYGAGPDTELAQEVMAKVASGMLANGEPGLFNSSYAGEGESGDVRSTNPCGEIALEAWEQCCLGHVNLAHPAHEDPEHLEESFQLMARFLVRATCAPSSDERQENVKNVNRRIGVGFFGFQEWLAAQGIRYSDSIESMDVAKALQAWKAHVRFAADDEADRLAVPRPIKTTTIAPTGSIAKLPGVSEGIHPVYAKHFLRRVRYAVDSPELARLKQEGRPTEPCIYSQRTEVVSFFVEDMAVERFGSHLIESVDEVGLDVLLSVQQMVQGFYADNAVSFTANIDPERYTAQELEDIISSIGPDLKGTTVFPDLSRPQSPMERMSEEEFLAARFHEFGQSIDDECASGACPVR